MLNQKLVTFLITGVVLCSVTVSASMVDSIVISKTKKHIQPSNNTIIPVEFKDKNIEIHLNPSSKYHYSFIDGENKFHTLPYPYILINKLESGDNSLIIKNSQGSDFTITFQVSKPFWQKWWFWPSIIVYVLMIIGIGIYLFFLYDFRQKLKMQYVRNQIASDLHDEVGSNLNSIAIFVELLKKKIPNAQPDLLSLISKITQNSEETVSLMRDTVWAINPDNDNTEKLFEKMESFGIEILSSMGVVYNFENRVDLKKIQFNMDQRRNIYLIYKEAINNISKHAQATKANCKVFIENQNCKIEITDNGCGFDISKTFEGNGLKNFKFRGADDEIEVQVESEINKGTKVIIIVYNF